MYNTGDFVYLNKNCFGFLISVGSQVNPYFFLLKNIAFDYGFQQIISIPEDDIISFSDIEEFPSRTLSLFLLKVIFKPNIFENKLYENYSDKELFSLFYKLKPIDSFIKF